MRTNAMSKLMREQNELVAKLKVATTFFSRFLGLMGRRSLPSDEAILFPRCNSIHTFFMRFPIDVVFLSAEGDVVAAVRSLSPWRMTFPKKGIKHTLELAPGSIDRLKIAEGQKLTWEAKA